MIRATCPECGHKHDFSDKHYGKSAKCRLCGTRLKIRPDYVNPTPPPAPVSPQHAAAPQQVVSVNSTTVIAAAQRDNTIAAVVNIFFSPFGFLVQGRLLTFMVYLAAWFLSLLLCLVGVGIIIIPILWIAGIVDALRYRG